MRLLNRARNIIDYQRTYIRNIRVDFEVRCIQLIALCIAGANNILSEKLHPPEIAFKVKKRFFIFKNPLSNCFGCMQLLKKAEALTSDDGLKYSKRDIQAILVKNAFANYYKSIGKFHAALQYMKFAFLQNIAIDRSKRLPISYAIKSAIHSHLSESSEATVLLQEGIALIEQQHSSIPLRSRSTAYFILLGSMLHNLSIELVRQ